MKAFSVSRRSSLRPRSRTLRMSQPKSRSRQAESTASEGASTGRGFRVPAILLEGDQPAEKSGPVQKYASAAAQSGMKLSRAEGLPEAYGTGKLGILARDPRCLYVF